MRLRHVDRFVNCHSATCIQQYVLCFECMAPPASALASHGRCLVFRMCLTAEELALQFVKDFAMHTEYRIWHGVGMA